MQLKSQKKIENYHFQIPDIDKLKIEFLKIEQ